MNLSELQRKLMAAARANRPSEAVPYMFEKRIMARLTPLPADVWAPWGRALWRAAAACVTISVLLVAWSSFSSDEASATNLSQVFDSTVYAAADQLNEPW